MTDHFLANKTPAWIAGAAGLGVVGALLLAVGQPILSDDIWLHLSLGRAYLAEGPWLEADPLLANPLGVPLPAAWGTDIVFALVQQLGGFQALRLLHVLLVAAVVGLLSSILYRASRSPQVVILATSAFITLAAYRLVQIRPHLFSMLALLLLYRLLFEHRRTPAPKQIAGAVLVFGLWANLHAAFVLGPILTAAGVAGILLAALLGDRSERAVALRRARVIALAGILGTLATLVNPSGFESHLAFLIAGEETPSLTRVADEWLAVDLFAWPKPRLPPAPLTWATLWLLWVVTPLMGLGGFFRHYTRHGSPAAGSDAAFPGGLDPALVVMAGAALCAPLIAVRFAWLGVLPLIVLAQASRHFLTLPEGEAIRRGRALNWAGALAAWALFAAFIQLGPWPMISAIMPRNLVGYSAPYPAAKYNAQAIWMLADAELEGTLYGEYSAGGFYGFWLSPGIKTFLNGTLNVAPETIAANRPILERRGERKGETFTDLLDRHGIDLFLGGQLPKRGRSDRPWYYTTAHLERTPGWILIFRNLTGAVYLRDNSRNRENIERVTSYYRRQGVPFRSEHGFEIERVIFTRPDWAMAHGVIPIYFPDLLSRGSASGSAQDREAADHLAMLFATLGLYEKAIAVDRPRLEVENEDVGIRRRLAWCLLRSGDLVQAAQIAEALEGSGDPLAETIFVAAQAAAAGDLAPGQIQILPLLAPAEATSLTSMVIRPDPRNALAE